MSDSEKLGKVAEKLGIGSYRRHVLLCLGPECCSPEEGEQAWNVLKQELKNAGLVQTTNGCYRSKVGCLRVCQNGPIAVVYPEGTWYQEMTANRIPRLINEHLIQGKPITEWIFANNPLGSNDTESATE